MHCNMINGGDFFTGDAARKYVNYCLDVYNNLPADPYAKNKIRRRSYQKYLFDETKGLRKSGGSQYFQTYLSNNKDGGVVRQFGSMPNGFVDSEFLQSVLEKDLIHMFAHHKYLFNDEDKCVLGVHPIRYNVTPDHPSFSSPLWLHKDDEKLVYLHFICRNNVVGGQSVISGENNSIEKVIDLEGFMDTLVLTHDFFHAVTPIGCGNGNEFGYRDILLVTLEDKVQNK